MKINETVIRRLIRESLIKEIGPYGSFDKEPYKKKKSYEETAKQSIEVLGRGIIKYVPVETLLKKYGTKLVKLLSSAIDILSQYDKAKRESGLRDSDKYFHYLSFYNAITELDLGGVSPEDAASLFVYFGASKENVDYLNPFGATPAIKIGQLESLKEYYKDMNENVLGLIDGLKTLQGKMSEADAHKKALDKLEHTLADQKGLSKNPDFWDKKYGWASKSYPKVYGDDKKFIQPRYNATLKPSERLAAYKKSLGEIPSFAAKIKGSLRIK